MQTQWTQTQQQWTQTQWTAQSLAHLFEWSSTLSLQYHTYNSPASQKILVNAFFEPSTRTALSFECAMKRLGGNVITFHPSTSSIQKGEEDYDTLKTLEKYGDAIVLRHPRKSFLEEIRPLVSVPIINAGNGNGDHPTQALLDLYTLYKTFGPQEFQRKTILFIGDIRHSRTIHSLIQLLHLYPQTNLFLSPYEGCEPEPDYIRKISFIHHQREEDIVVPLINMESSDYSSYDVVYITRKQKERHHAPSSPSPPTPFTFTNAHANMLHEDAIIMHPLPRNEELDRDVDQNHRAYYFKQMEYGVEIRMGLLDQMFAQQEEEYKKNHENYPSLEEVAVAHQGTQEWFYSYIGIVLITIYLWKYIHTI